jgi:arylsulfatase A-like enzyme
VQLFTGNQTWDHHSGIFASLPAACKYVDKPAAGLVMDLKARGLLDSTIVHWGGEMGRLPVVQYDGPREKMGRDHNTNGFSMWVAGGGFKAGMTYGETDEFGHKAVKDVVKHSDYHATVLKLFGLDHAKLTYKRNGADVSLTDNQGGQVIEQVLA